MTRSYRMGFWLILVTVILACGCPPEGKPLFMDVVRAIGVTSGMIGSFLLLW